MEILGKSLIGFRDSTSTGAPFSAWNPATGEKITPAFFSASPQDVARAAELASDAFSVYSRLPGTERASFLNRIASRIESITDLLVARAHAETALPEPRLKSETARTCNQLRLFASVVEEGSWVCARIDHGDPQRKPLPKPDVRSMLFPLGPMVVFGASNFPLAFSVAGGDTASALAAGNPVIVKAHPAHPGTSELVGRTIQESVRECGLPEGVFSLLFDAGTRVGTELLKHPLVKAGGFTGSRTAGRILMDLAASRPEPIPFFAEMSSTNPVFILLGALKERGENIATGLHTSFTMGAGQFCTKPGMVFLPQAEEAQAFSQKLQQLMKGTGSFHLLTKGICSSYGSAIEDRGTNQAVELLAEAPPGGQGGGFGAQAALFQTDAEAFLNSDLADEIFGPTTLLVNHSSRDQVLDIAKSLEGHLTATIHGTEHDLRDFADLIAILENKVGRLIFNGFPTGVEVTHAMVH